MKKRRVLIVDDEKNIGFVIHAMLEKAGFEPVVFSESVEAQKAIPEGDFSAIVTDLYMPGMGGMELLQWCQAHCPQIPIVMITAYATVESAVQALKSGAFDFITKPFDQVELVTVVRKAVDTYVQRQKEPIALFPTTKAGETARQESIGMIGTSPEMQEVFRMISKIAPSSSTVLILGESGTGKELVAYEVHRLSTRQDKPFIKINCAAIPATLIESELFGYERGAFTGAVTSKPGRFELANGGTLFLDEVGDMALEMQVKLLRVLQEHEFVPVGGVNTVRIDVRIITATNKDLEAEVKSGRFREDLYYRLNVVPVRLPPLRERRQDVETFVKTFLKEFNSRFTKSVSHIEPACLSALKHYDWPGNIRQLENVIERMVLMSDGGTLHVEELPSEISTAFTESDALVQGESPEDLSNFKELVRRRTQAIERELIERALEETTGNVTRAAEKLGLSRKGLQLKLKELGIKRALD